MKTGQYPRILCLLTFLCLLGAGCGLNNVRNEFTVVDGSSYSFLMTEDEALVFDPEVNDVIETAGEIKYLDKPVGLILFGRTPDVAAAMILARPAAVQSLRLASETICAPAVQDALRDTGTQALLLDFNDDENFDPVDLACLQELHGIRLYLYLPRNTQAAPALKNLAGNSGVWIIHLPFAPVKADDLQPLATLTNLRELQLWSTGVDDEGLRFVEKLTKLRELNLGDGKITDEGLARLKNLKKMRRLFLWGTKITDHGLAHLTGMTDMRKLLLNMTQIGDDGLVYVAQLKQLRSLNLFQTRITDDGLTHLTALTELEELNLEATAVTDRGLEHLKSLKKLRKLQLIGTRCTEQGIQNLQQVNPELGVAF